MELFKNTNIDFLGKKTPFIVFSLVLLAAGAVSLAVKGGPRYGIDFRGGALMNVKFAERVSEDEIRKALSPRIPGEIIVQPVVGTNEVMIGTEMRSEQELEAARQNLIEALAAGFGAPEGKADFNAVGQERLTELLLDPFQRAGIAMSTPEIRELAGRMLEFRDTPPRSGLITDFDQLKAVQGVTPEILNVLKQELGLGKFAVRSVDIVGPKIGAELREQAVMATLFALGGMLVYIAFRFEWIYGVASVIAVFHDVLITVGLFSIFDKEINLTVIAALLTLVGYSMNDTIVIFDRIRENLKLMRKESYPRLVNISINQTLSRTIMTSGLTFLAVLSLYLFGGPVLNPFSFALVIGILVGTYSTIFIASPIVVYWHNVVESRKRRAAVAAPAAREAKRAASKALK
jgi:preprotein translocase subunit SecF